MCVIVEYGDKNVESVGDLRALWPVLDSDVRPGGTDDECLCNTDVEAVLDRAGVTWKFDFMGDYIVEVNE